MKNRIKHPSVGGFNVGRGSLQALHPQNSLASDTVTEYQKLTEWEKVNNYTRKQSRRLIRQNKLLAIKHQGVWWVKVNPRCEEHILDF